MKGFYETHPRRFFKLTTNIVAARTHAEERASFKALNDFREWLRTARIDWSQFRLGTSNDFVFTFEVSEKDAAAIEAKLAEFELQKRE